jgi:hypothetical protein
MNYFKVLRHVILFTGLWYGQEVLAYPALLIVLECCTINICAADISQKVISLQLKWYALIEWQFHVDQILLPLEHTSRHKVLPQSLEQGTVF